MKTSILYFLSISTLFLVTTNSYAQNITAMNPASNGTNIPINTNLSLTFDSVINSTLFNNTAIVITGAQTGEITGSFSGIDTNTITFNPDQDFKHGELISISISNTTAHFVGSFTTAVNPNSPGEFFYGQETISTQTDGAFCVRAADLDGDGDVDVLSASLNDNRIAWYENDGSGTFGAQQIITTLVNYAAAVEAVDIDGDGDLDVLSASSDDDRIAWYENDGVGNFGPQQTITTNANLIREIYTADLDGDGDMDVLSPSLNTNNIFWYENNGTGSSWTEHNLNNGSSSIAIYAGDLDNDGDIDILSAPGGNSAWFENDGNGNFGAQQNISTTSNIFDVFAADLDNDGDLDVLLASTSDDISWYENDGTGIFAPRQFVTMAIFSAKSVYAADIDGDGDMDVLSASSGDNKIAWYENDGTGNFGTLQTISTAANSPRSIYAADLDNDGDMDVLSASLYDDRIACYKNESNTLSIATNELTNTLELFPNPTNSLITVKTEKGTSVQQIEIYDLTGRLLKTVHTINSEETIRIDISSLHAASYLVKVITDNGLITKKLIKT